VAADRLTVDLNGLELLAEQLESIRLRLDAVRGLGKRLEEELGSATVSAALKRFDNNWSDGRAQIDGNAGRLASMANEAVCGFRQTDADLAAELKAVTSGGS
jgi:hypothetical protein